MFVGTKTKNKKSSNRGVYLGQPVHSHGYCCFSDQESDKMKPNLFGQTCDFLVHKNVKIKCYFIYIHKEKQQIVLCDLRYFEILKSFILILENHHALFALWKKLE